MEIFKNKARTRNGYTLIEMLVVLGIILLVLGMGAPFFHNFSGGSSLKIAAREVGTVLRTARSYAMSRNENYEAFFDAATNTYSIRRSSDGTTMDRVYLLPSGVTFAASATIRFTANGGIASDCPTNPPNVTVTSKGVNKQVTVETATGAVTIP